MRYLFLFLLNNFSFLSISDLIIFDPFLFISSNVIGGVAGLTADANSLVNFARTAAQQHLLQYNEDIPVELLAQRLCDMKQGYTQFGGIQTHLLDCAIWKRSPILL